MSLALSVKSVLRYAVNRISHAVIRDEALRKLLVERYYATQTVKINQGNKPAEKTAGDLLDWRMTMSFRLGQPREVYRANAFYGIGKSLCSYAGVDLCAKACIEHGVHFGNYVNEQELDGSGLPCLITFGQARFEHIRSVSDVPVAMVGPYIAYASDYLDSGESAVAKQMIGKTLLVFPSHSVDRVKVSYETSAFFAEVERVRGNNDVDSVLVCLYYRDLLNGAAVAYESSGYRVVTAGYREDPLFLARLRSLIKLADLTMSNNVGTHVGYCAWLGRPHCIFDQRKLYASDSSLDDSEFDNEFAASQAAEKSLVSTAFLQSADKRTAEQKAVLNRYWGFNKTRTQEEMRALLAACEKAYEAPASERQEAFREITDSDKRLAGIVE